MTLALDTAQLNSRRYKITKARLTLASDIRTALSAANPNGNIFDLMDRADAEVEAMTDREVQQELIAMGLEWSGQYWMKPERINA